MRYYSYKRYIEEVKIGNPLKIFIKSIVLSPLKLALGITYFAFKGISKIVDIFKSVLKKDDTDKFKKIRPVRYINKNLGKLEEYSNIRAVASVNNFKILSFFLFTF